MDNTQILEKTIAAFEKNDPSLIPELFAEDGEWQMIGKEIETVKGRDMQQWFQQNQGIEMISSTINHKIISGNTAAVDGEVVCKGPDGKVSSMFYIDVYDFENGKIKLMKSYTSPKEN